jgi:hypothetical protein
VLGMLLAAPPVEGGGAYLGKDDCCNSEWHCGVGVVCECCGGGGRCGGGVS